MQNEIYENLKSMYENTEDPKQKEALAFALKSVFNTLRITKLRQAHYAIKSLDNADPNFFEKLTYASKDLEYPEHEYLPIELKDIIEAAHPIESKTLENGNMQVTFSKEQLEYLINVCEDDGMGYCTHNTDAFAADRYKNELRLWV